MDNRGLLFMTGLVLASLGKLIGHHKHLPGLAWPGIYLMGFSVFL